MKLFILVTAVAFAHAAKLDKTYLPPNYQSSGGADGILQTPLLSSGSQKGDSFARNANIYAQNGKGFRPEEYNGFGANFGSVRAERPRAALERNAAILRQKNNNDGETYSYSYETENGIYAEENGVATNGVEAQGGFAYTDDDGKLYSIRYTAGQNGFVPQGDHLPTPPPIPEEILKALEQNARDEAAGIYDDGSYNEAKYDEEIARNIPYRSGNVNPPNGFSSVDNDDAVVTNSAVFRSTGAKNAPVNRYNTGNDNVLRTQVTFGNKPDKTYLPPFASQRGLVRGGQSYNPRNGYRY